MNITVEQRQIYGNTFFYPACEQSKLFCKLTDSKTLTRRAIDTIKELGYKIDVKTKVEQL